MLWPEMMSLAHMMRSSVVQQDWVLPAMKSVGDNWASWTVTSFVMQPIRQCFSIGILYLQILIWRQQVTDKFVHREMHLWRNTSLNTILASWPSASPSPTHFQCTKMVHTVLDYTPLLIWLVHPRFRPRPPSPMWDHELLSSRITEPIRWYQCRIKSIAHVQWPVVYHSNYK